jgi:hypothetical protein
MGRRFVGALLLVTGCSFDLPGVGEGVDEGDATDEWIEDDCILSLGNEAWLGGSEPREVAASAYGGVYPHDDGFWVVLTREGSPTLFALDTRGKIVGEPVTLGAEWEDARVWPGPDAALITSCRDEPTAFFVDQAGNAISTPTAIGDGSACLDEISVAWTTSGNALAAWVGHASVCESSCAAVASLSTDVPPTLYALHPLDGFTIGRDTTSIAAGPRTAVAATITEGGAGAIFPTLIITALDLDGLPRAEPLYVPLNPSSEAAQPEGWLEDDRHPQRAHAMPDGEDGFFVYVGGYGPSLGRIHIGPNGEVRAPFDELPPLGDSTIVDAFDAGLAGLTATDGVGVAWGRAWASGDGSVLVSLGEGGHIANVSMQEHRHVFHVATHGGRTWVLFADLYTASTPALAELRCG